MKEEIFSMENTLSQEKVIVIDFGGQYNQLVARRVRECNVYCEIYSYKTDLEQIKAMNLSDYVTLKGNQPREYIYKHICDYNLYVQPSRIEGFGLTVAEAMAAKVPVLISDNPGPMQVIANGKYGYYFESDSVDGCANAIEHILDNYPTKEFIDSAYHYVLSYFSIESTARKYVALYEDILKK